MLSLCSVVTNRSPACTVNVQCHKAISHSGEYLSINVGSQHFNVMSMFISSFVEHQAVCGEAGDVLLTVCIKQTN